MSSTSASARCVQTQRFLHYNKNVVKFSAPFGIPKSTLSTMENVEHRENVEHTDIF